MIELRSDTLTQPTDAMRQAMAAAPVGDDVFGEDPTVNELQSQVAQLLGKPAALFVPSGTMSNQIGVRLHCQGGDEFLCEAQCHIYYYEQAAYAQLFGVAAVPIVGAGGLLTVADIQDRIRGADIHSPRTRLLCLENTHNRLGGRILPYEGVAEVCTWAREQGLPTHLDGARLWNAAVATGIPEADWAQHFDTVSVCFSKGLGAPVGSALVGNEAAIEAARRIRKPLGGGMRQAGILAAGALHALHHHRERLSKDHANAQILADAVRETSSLQLVDNHCDTNLVMFDLDPARGPAADYADKLKDHGVLLLALGKQRLRAVAHLGVTTKEAEQAARALRTV